MDDVSSHSDKDFFKGNAGTYFQIFPYFTMTKCQKAKDNSNKPLHICNACSSWMYVHAFEYRKHRSAEKGLISIFEVISTTMKSSGQLIMDNSDICQGAFGRGTRNASFSILLKLVEPPNDTSVQRDPRLYAIFLPKLPTFLVSEVLIFGALSRCNCNFYLFL